jgi:hypothetical protein
MTEETDFGGKTMEYGILVYDVPLTRRKVYNKLRDRLRRISVPMTWSVYLTPFGYRDQALAILKDLDEDEDQRDRLMYQYIKFDSSEQATLDALVRSEFDKMLRKAKDNLHQKLGEAEMEYDDDVPEKAGVQRGPLSKAMKKVKEARRLASVFEVTDVMEANFLALEKLVEARRERIKEELQKDKEAREAAVQSSAEEA